jgi:hypothetical protein
MKKALIGCGILVLVLGIGGAVGAYYFLWKPAKAAVTEFAKLKEIPQINQQVANKATFNAPADNVLASDSVDRFVRTQQAIITKLGARADELSKKYELMDRARGNRTPTWTELSTAYKDFASLILEAKRAQVDALNQHKFSLAEYEWTRERVYEAAGIPVNFNLDKLIRAVSEGKSPEDIASAASAANNAPTVPEKNRTLVTPFKKDLADRAVLAAFGL